MTGCPNRFCSDLIPAVNFAALFEKGLMPLAGGTLDQSAKFIDFCQGLALEEARIRNGD